MKNGNFEIKRHGQYDSLTDMFSPLNSFGTSTSYFLLSTHDIVKNEIFYFKREYLNMKR